MEARELRFGLLFKYREAQVSVINIYKSGANFAYFEDSAGFYRSYDSIDFPKPIPLTEEWLMKFGFEIVKGAHQSWRTIKINEEKSFDIQFIDGDIFYSDTRLKHVHQLQNLFFALTGQELTYTP